MPSISNLKGKSCNQCRVINISRGCALAFQSRFPCVRCAALAQWMNALGDGFVQHLRLLAGKLALLAGRKTAHLVVISEAL